MFSKSDREHPVSFGPFRLLPTQRVLMEGGKPVRLGSRALDILIALVERPGELVGKRELTSLVWPDTVVVEANLTVHVAALRRALGDGQGDNRYIVNIPGRGYRFVAPVALVDELSSPAPQAATMARPHNLPTQPTRLIGRAKVIGDLVQQLSAQRLITIVGPAGIGKTAVALYIAEQLIGAYEHGVWLIDLAPTSDPRLVPTVLASALGLEIRSDNPLPGLIAALRDKQMLLVLDNCEHLIEAAATLATAILKGSRNVRVLATSREPLHVEGERSHRLSTLESPPALVPLRAAEVLRYPAVQLFVTRAAATLNEFELTDTEAPSAGDICRKLDGIPLAIEFAAARVDIFGVRGVAARLDDRLRLLTSGRRTALPRHQTIGAALDWSYQLLSKEEQIVFRRLAIFAGDFTLEAAGAVAADANGSLADIADAMSSLVIKSLVTADIGDREARFRLLETTRVFALTKLGEAGEVDSLGRRHATYYRDFLETARNSCSAEDEFAVTYAPEIDNIRAALTWAFALRGDRLIAVALAAASAPIWLEMSLLTECRGWMGKALDILDPADRGTRREMVLQTSLGLSLMFTHGMSTEARETLTRANELAEGLHDSDFQLRTLSGLTLFCIRLEDCQGTLALSRRSEAIAKDVADPVAVSTADCLRCCSLFFVGEYAEALTYAHRVERRITPAVRRAHIVRSGIDHSIWARSISVHILWSQGLLDQSAQAAKNVLADAKKGGHPVSLCLALTWSGCIISLRSGDLEAAERWIALLKGYTEKHASNSYYASALGFEGQLLARRGNGADGQHLLRASLAGLREAQYEMLYTPLLSGLAEVLALAGRLDESLAVADEALQRTERNDAFWWMPEALRIKGEILLLSNSADTTSAEDHFGRSLELAHRQGALSWELRTAISLARLQCDHDRIGEARDLLPSVYGRFTEGFDTADLRTAKTLLDSLQ